MSALIVPVKRLILKLTERNGEREYNHVQLVTVNARVKNFDKVANTIAKDYVNVSKPKFEDGGYYGRGGETHVSVFGIKEITEEEFQVMQKYI